MKKIFVLLLFCCFVFIGCSQAVDNQSGNIPNTTTATVNSESVATTPPATPNNNTTATDNKVVEKVVEENATPKTSAQVPPNNSTTTDETDNKIAEKTEVKKTTSKDSLNNFDLFLVDVATRVYKSTSTTAPSSTPASPTPTPSPTKTTSPPPTPTTNNNDNIIKNLFNQKQSNVQVRGSGVVIKVLPDDNEGSRHQRFILRLNSGQTLLVAHNIDLASRLNGLAVGEKIEFYGEYYYNSEGGGIHWTHHDPNGKHVAGYLKRIGKIQQATTTTPPPTNKSNITHQKYIGNRNSQVLHAPTCDSLPYERNRIYFSTIQEALGKGYRKHYECMGN